MGQNNIATRQNEQEFLDYLAAQRHLYSKAKCLSNIIFVMCVLFPVLLAIAKVLFPDCAYLPKVIVIYSFVATLLRIWLKDIMMTKKTLAARIQQLIDTELFGLDWNKAHCGEKPQPEEIHKAIKGAKYDKLQNWYDPIVSQLPLPIGALVCMRTNVVYDQSLRKSYSTFCYVLTGLAIIVVCILGMLNNTGMWDAFLYGLVPLMPLITWLIDLYKQHTANCNALCNIQPLIETGLERAKNKLSIDNNYLEEIQNFIFVHRKTSYMIPDSFYKICRRRNEEAASYGSKYVCEKYILL